MSILMEVQRWLKERMDDNLFQHSVAVAELAAEIARRYGADEEQARLAGLIHDCGKTYSSKELIAFSKSFGHEPDEIEKINPVLLHSVVGPGVFESVFGKIPKAVKSAVELHTTGNAKMDKMDKIIYIADSLEPNRHYPGLVQIREKIRWDLDFTLYLVIQRKIQHTLETRKQIHPKALDAWNWIIPLIKNKRL